MKGTVGDLMDKYVKEQGRDFALLRLSRAKLIEIAVLRFLDQKGVLEKYLSELGYEDSQIKRIKQYLQAAV